MESPLRRAFSYYCYTFSPRGKGMALVQCVECGEQVSDQAKACPKCGAPAPKKSGYMPLLLLLIVLAIMAFFMLGALGRRSGGESTARTYTGHLRVDDGTEYVMEEAPSPIGSTCEGWSSVSIQKPGQPDRGIRDLMCWRRVGDQIETQDRYGQNRKSVPDFAISDEP